MELLCRIDIAQVAQTNVVMCCIAEGCDICNSLML